MTEDQAKTKWCPFARGILDQGGNRMAWGGSGGEPDLPTDQVEYAADMADLYPCIGSSCMAWRWAREPNPDWKPQPHQMAEWIPSNPYSETPAWVSSETDGHCGLAGPSA